MPTLRNRVVIFYWQNEHYEHKKHSDRPYRTILFCRSIKDPRYQTWKYVFFPYSSSIRLDTYYWYMLAYRRYCETNKIKKMCADLFLWIFKNFSHVWFSIISSGLQVRIIASLFIRLDGINFLFIVVPLGTHTVNIFPKISELFWFQPDCCILHY